MSTVYTSSVLWCAFQCVCVVMAVCDDSACLVLLCCVVGCGMAVCVGCVVSSLVSLLFFLSFSSSVSFVVGVRGSARAAMRARTLSPNAIASPLLLALFSLLLASLRAPPFLLLWNGGGLPCVTVLCWHDGYG